MNTSKWTRYAEAAKQAGVTPERICQLVSDGTLKRAWILGVPVVLKSDVRKYIREREKRAAAK